MLKCRHLSPSFSIHKSKILPRLNSLKEFKEEYEDFINVKLSKFNHKPPNSARKLKEKEAISDLKEKLRVKTQLKTSSKDLKSEQIESQTPLELKGLLVRSEMENLFTKKKAALEFFKKTMNWKMPNKSKAEFTDLYPDDILLAAKEGDIKKSFVAPSTRNQDDNFDSKSYFKNLTNNHERNIEQEKSRRLALKMRRIEGKYRGSENIINGSKSSVERITFHSEKPNKKKNPFTNRKLTLSSRGPRLKTDIDEFSDKEDLHTSFKLSKRARTATCNPSAKPQFLINDSSSNEKLEEFHKGTSLGYVSDGFKKPSKLRPRPNTQNKISPFSVRRGARPLSGLTVNNIVLQPSLPDDTDFGTTQQGFRFTSSSFRMRSTSKGSIENSHHLYSSSQLRLDDKVRHQTSKLISQNIYSFCQTKSKDGGKSQLLSRLFVQCNPSVLK